MPGTSIDVPDVDACGWSSTCHVPAPLPASVRRTSSARLAAPRVTTRSSNESDDRVGEELRVGGARQRDEAAALERHGSFLRASGIAPGGATAVETSADFTCDGVQPG